MVLTYVTVSKIDQQVRIGLPIGYYGKGDDLSALPDMLGDWNIKTVTEDRNPGTGYIVAVPSNMRTRFIYKEGRLAWLAALGYSESQALLYYRACNRVTKKWDLRVAMFVLDNFTTDPFIIDNILASSDHQSVCTENRIHTKLSQKKIEAGCQILVNMRGLQ